MVQDDGSAGLDRVEVVFDDQRAVSDAGIVLVVALAQRLGIEALAQRFVRLGDRVGAANAGRKVMTLLYAMVLGADCIDDCELLRDACRRCWAGSRPRPHWGRSCARSPSAMSASSTGCSPKHCGALGRPEPVRGWSDWWSTLTASSVRSAATPSRAPVSVTRAGVAITRCWPRADTGEVLHIRLRKGSAGSPRGVLRFVEELIARVTRASARGPKLLRADSAFWNKKLIARLERASWRYSISVRMQYWLPAAIAKIPEAAWRTLEDYPPQGEAQIAETIAGGRRLIIRRTRLVGAQAELWPDWRYFPFITNRTEPLQTVEAEPRQHAVVELAIRDLLRWTSVIGLPNTTIRAARTVRRRLLTLPGRLTTSARRSTLHLPARWPWQHDFVRALARIRTLPAFA
jgi:hypothetical protein